MCKSSLVGTVFDIKQLSVFDGPGIRTTVFLKGCPLRCDWCHNPEGLSPFPELMVGGNCGGCGNCQKVCPSPESCRGCGKCAQICPLGIRRICGTRYTAEALADLLLRDAGYLKENDGGYTLSGGEPLYQPAFTLELLERLEGNHRAIETSGFCSGEVFSAAMERVELLIMDLKLIDSALHHQHTGVDNHTILSNLKRLKQGVTPFLIRIPLIPGVNDGDENLSATAALLKNAPRLLGVELLPYHKTAGAKYAMVGKQYLPRFDCEQTPKAIPGIFLHEGIPCRIL